MPLKQLPNSVRYATETAITGPHRAKFANAAGAMVIAAVSSSKKEELLQSLGADEVVRYDKDGDWGERVRTLTPGPRGADHIIEVGGAGTLDQSLKAIKLKGLVSIIGAVSSESGRMPSILECWTRTFTARGVVVGSRATIEDMALVYSNRQH